MTEEDLALVDDVIDRVVSPIDFLLYTMAKESLANRLTPSAVRLATTFKQLRASGSSEQQLQHIEIEHVDVLDEIDFNI